MDRPNLTTVNDIFFLIAARNQDRAMLCKRGSHWAPVSSAEVYRYVVGVARALSSWGLRKGDRVAILSENRFEWAIADFACLALGLVDVPIYPTLTAEQTAYILNDAAARALFISTPVQLQKLQGILAGTQVERVIAMDDPATSSALPMQQLMLQGPQQPDADFDAQARAIASDDLATIIYTSGTTGTPKGAMLTHGNLASNLAHSLESFGLDPDDLAISCLPLSHITARHTDYAMFQHGVPVAYCPSMDALEETLLAVRPTIFVGVPRLYEKIRNKVEAVATGPVKRPLYEWALRVGRGHMDDVLAGRRPASREWKVANRLVFSKIAAGFGGRGRIFISGGAPLGRDLGEWFASVGIRICEGYGLTETSPVIALNTPQAYKLGSVGKPLPNVECRIADDGEILVRGPSIFKSYWNKPEETAAAFQDGWFKTGDIGSLDQDGFLSITDRKKDLIKTSGGKFIAPQPIESALKANPLVAQAAVIGDRRKFPAVLIAPYFPMLEDWARANGMAFSSRKELVADPKVQAVYHAVVESVNQDLAQFEKIKRVLLVPDEFSIASGDLTPTLKLKRRVIESKYRDQIDALYAAADSPAPRDAGR
jgi:long-chain acyl-CoA synthetase